jgi:hypothetical protein
VRPSPYRDEPTTTHEEPVPLRKSRRERLLVVALTASLFASTFAYFAYSVHTLPVPLSKDQCHLEISLEPDHSDRGWREASEMKCESLVPLFK